MCFLSLCLSLPPSLELFYLVSAHLYPIYLYLREKELHKELSDLLPPNLPPYLLISTRLHSGLSRSPFRPFAVGFVKLHIPPSDRVCVREREPRPPPLNSSGSDIW
ncbi:hypothetical protein F4809DRAFT_596376 [Biscogniauxia mediterranea]|nr:hypothetical protein F4809DRAFT_596376 [Biscogniauxia mediterranea]